MPIFEPLLTLKAGDFVAIECEIVVAKSNHHGIGEGVALVDAHARHQFVLLIRCIV